MCIGCKSQAFYRCGSVGCETKYCGKTCQQNHWEIHQYELCGAVADWIKEFVYIKKNNK